MVNATDIANNNLETLKRSLIEIGESISPSEAREQAAIAEKEKQLSLARKLTNFLYSETVRHFYCNQRNLCQGMLRNANKAAILRKIVTRHLTGEEDQLYLTYHHDIGYSFYHSAKQFAADLFINPSTVYKLIKSLEVEGWIAVHLKQDLFGRKIYHLKLNIQNFIKRAETFMQSHLSFFDKCVYQNLPNVSYINKQKKEITNMEPENSSDQKNSSPGQSPQSPEEPATNYIFGEPKKSLDNDISNSPEETEFPQVDEKINKERKSDRYFGQKKPSQQEQIRRRAKVDSAIGMSGFRDVEDLRKCQKELTIYFAKQLDPLKAAEKASFVIKAERQGERSPFVQDYLDGLAIGSWCKEEWEIEPGRVAPVLIAYLRCKLRKNGDTHAQSLNKVSWELKNRNLTANHWAECKRLIDIEKPRLAKALERGQDLVAQNIPEWIVEIYRPEISVQQAAETAEVLGAIATQYNERVEQVQKQLEPAKSDEILPDVKDSPLFKLKQALGLPTDQEAPENTEQAPESDELDFVEEQRKRVERADAVMDAIVSDGKKLELAEILPSLPEAKIARLQSEIEEISDLLADPITRESGLRRAKNLRLPILYSNDGEAIAVDTLAIKEDDEINFSNLSSDGTITSTEGKYQAHQIYQPEEIEKGSKSAWQEAIARSKFLTNRLKKS